MSFSPSPPAVSDLLRECGVCSSSINQLIINGFSSVDRILSLNERMMRSFGLGKEARASLQKYIIHSRCIFSFELFCRGYSTGVTGVVRSEIDFDVWEEVLNRLLSPRDGRLWRSAVGLLLEVGTDVVKILRDLELPFDHTISLLVLPVEIIEGGDRGDSTQGEHQVVRGGTGGGGGGGDVALPPTPSSLVFPKRQEPRWQAQASPLQQQTQGGEKKEGKELQRTKHSFKATKPPIKINRRTQQLRPLESSITGGGGGGVSAPAPVPAAASAAPAGNAAGDVVSPKKKSSSFHDRIVELGLLEEVPLLPALMNLPEAAAVAADAAINEEDSSKHSEIQDVADDDDDDDDDSLGLAESEKEELFNQLSSSIPPNGPEEASDDETDLEDGESSLGSSSSVGHVGASDRQPATQQVLSNSQSLFAPSSTAALVPMGKFSPSRHSSVAKRDSNQRWLRLRPSEVTADSLLSFPGATTTTTTTTASPTGGFAAVGAPRGRAHTAGSLTLFTKAAMTRRRNTTSLQTPSRNDRGGGGGGGAQVMPASTIVLRTPSHTTRKTTWIQSGGHTVVTTTTTRPKEATEDHALGASREERGDEEGKSRGVLRSGKHSVGSLFPRRGRGANATITGDGALLDGRVVCGRNAAGLEIADKLRRKAGSTRRMPNRRLRVMKQGQAAAMVRDGGGGGRGGFGAGKSAAGPKRLADHELAELVVDHPSAMRMADGSALYSPLLAARYRPVYW